MSSGSLRKSYTDGKGQKEKTGQDWLAHDSSIQQTDRRRCSQIVTVLLIYFLLIYFTKPWSNRKVRQRLDEVAVNIVARPNVNAEKTITRLRPMRSAILPVRGAASPTPARAFIGRH